MPLIYTNLQPNYTLKDFEGEFYFDDYLFKSYFWWNLKCFAILKTSVKVNKSVYIAKSRQRHHKPLTNILLHVSNHTSKDMYMLDYGTF